MLITVIGRGHSGTRAMSHTLSASGVFMGESLNGSGDLVPAEELYEACTIFGRHVKHLGGNQWDFSAAYETPIDPAFTRLVESYLGSVLGCCEPVRGWKLPETTLVLPWIVRMFPDARYIYWMRDPRDSILGDHLTDDLARFGVPYEATDDIRQMRIASWLYQYEIMRQTPSPKFRLDLQFERFVMNQAETLRQLESFLGFAMAEIEVRPESVGRWRNDPDAELSELFPPQTLYNQASDVAQP